MLGWEPRGLSTYRLLVAQVYEMEVLGPKCLAKPAWRSAAHLQTDTVQNHRVPICKVGGDL